MQSILVIAVLLVALSTRSGALTSYIGSRMIRIRALVPLNDLPPSMDRNEDGSYSNKADVKEVLNKLMQVLTPKAPSDFSTASVDDEITPGMVQDKFNKILEGVRESRMSDIEKSLIMTEASLLLTDVKEQGGTQNVLGSGVMSPQQRLGGSFLQTCLYDEKTAPWCLVYSSGAIGQAAYVKMKSLGKSVDVKYVDGESLSTMQESEINFAIRHVKTVIIAADSKPADSKSVGGLFGGGGVGGAGSSGKGWSPILNEKSLKRLLNAVMNDRKRRGSQDAVKVVSLARATKQPKSLGSFLGGETTDFDSEVILQCNQRQLGHCVVKFGSILDDTSPFPSGVKDRSIKGSMSALSNEEAKIAQPVYENPLVLTTSRVEQADVTRLSVAVDALFRAASLPYANATISVLSAPTAASTSSALAGAGDGAGAGAGALGIPVDEQWDDEFLKLSGPELFRIPLRFASERQVALRLGRIVQELKDPKSGLITPIEVERFANGARIIFVPKESSYVSSREEKDKKREEDEATFKSASATSKPKQTLGYSSPEEEARRELEKQAASMSAGAAVSVGASKKKKMKPEGGLEIIVESKPYRRVRIKRCNMGPETIVKEESEEILLKALTRGIAGLENDYRLAVMQGMKL